MTLIPDSILSDETNIFDELFRRFGEIDLTRMLIYIIDAVDASALPHLAWQFHITNNEGWQLATSDEQRRQLIKKSISLHKMKGKISGITYILKLLGFVVTCEKWNEYGGDPYHFKLSLTSGSHNYTDTIAAQISRIIDEYKRASNVLDSIELNLSTQSLAPYYGGFGVAGLKITGGA